MSDSVKTFEIVVNNQAFTILQREHEPDADRWLQEAEQLLYELTHEPPAAPAAYNIESLQLD